MHCPDTTAAARARSAARPARVCVPRRAPAPLPALAAAPNARLQRETLLARVAAVELPRSAGKQVEPQDRRAPEQWEPVGVQQQQEDEQDLELVELDSQQEQLLSWMLGRPDAEQAEELDEMVDYDEFVDDEFSELREEVQQLLSLPAQTEQLGVGDKVLGTVFEVAEAGAWIDIGSAKAAGFVPLAECSFAKLRSPHEVLRVGMQREFLVVQPEDEHGQVVLSLGAIEAGMFWQRIRQLHEEEATVSVRVESVNRGGLLVHYGPYDGFLPVSQFGPAITPECAEEVVGQEIPVKFLEVDESLERLVFSNKRVSTNVPDMASQRVEVGDVLLGVVMSIKSYGAFVDVGGLTGLLHVSQLSHNRVHSLERVLKPGDKIKVMVLSHDIDQGRLVLSTKKLEPLPGDMLRDPQLVFDQAEEMAARFKAALEAARVGSLDVDAGGPEQQAAGNPTPPQQ